MLRDCTVKRCASALLKQAGGPCAGTANACASSAALRQGDPPNVVSQAEVVQ